jgi:hypothetical protein
LSFLIIEVTPDGLVFRDKEGKLPKRRARPPPDTR